MTMTTEKRNRTAAHGPASGDHLDGDHPERSNDLGLPPMPPEVARIFAEADPASIRAIARQMAYTDRAQRAAREAADNLLDASYRDAATILEVLREEFVKVAELAKIGAGLE